MENNLDILEEFDATREIQSPHLVHGKISPVTKQRIAYSVYMRKPEEILLINDTAFYVDAVFAGLTEKQVEYFAKNAPREYKESIMKIFEEGGGLNEAWGVAKSMDSAEGKNSDFHQKRFRKVVQYIKDNQAVFKF